MDISTSVLALFVSLLSLAFSVHTVVWTRRASQLQRLASIRTKLSSMMWSIASDLPQYERCAKTFDQFSDSETKFERDLSWLKDVRATISELRSKVESVSSALTKYPLSVGAGQIDEIEHQVDSIAQGVDGASKNLLPMMLKLVERLESAYSGQRRELPTSVLTKGVAP